MRFQSPQSQSELQIPSWAWVVDSHFFDRSRHLHAHSITTLWPRLYNLFIAEPAILTLEVGSLQATFRPACQQPSLVLVLWRKIIKSVIDGWCSLDKLQGQTSLPWNSVASSYHRGWLSQISLVYTRNVWEWLYGVSGSVCALMSVNFR